MKVTKLAMYVLRTPLAVACLNLFLGILNLSRAVCVYTTPKMTLFGCKTFIIICMQIQIPVAT